MAVARCPEKERVRRGVRAGAFVLKGLGGSEGRCPHRNTLPDASAASYLQGTKDGTRAALYLRVSTADQKPDLQYDGLRAYATRAGLEVVQDYCDVAV